MEEKCRDMIILTKSKKWQNYCVAGIDMEKNKLVRLISNDEEIHNAIAAKHLKDNTGKEAKLFDRINVESSKINNSNCQPENYILDTSKKLQNKGKVSYDYIKAAIIFLSNRYDKILFNTLPTVTPRDLSKLPMDKVHSIELIKADFMVLRVKDFVNERLKASILYNDIWYDGLTITDMEFSNRYFTCVEESQEKRVTLRNVYALISLTDVHLNRHYKLIAAVYEFNK